MKLIAINTIYGKKKITIKGENGKPDAVKHEDLVAGPGKEVDTDEFGIDDAEAQSLIDSGAAKRKTREVNDDGPAKKPAPGGTGPAGSIGGTTA